MSSPDTQHPQPAPEPDPDIPHEYEHSSPFAFGDAAPTADSDRLERERAAYEAARHGNDLNRGHALGGTDGATEGQ